MIRVTHIPLLLSTLLVSFQASAVSDEQFEAVRALGDLNGVALNCKFIDETRRMKRSLVSTVPKLRVIGQAFDESTNDAFLKMIHEQTPCPTERALSQQVDQAIEQVSHTFAAPTPLLK